MCKVGDVTITLAWDNRNDLDLHVFTTCASDYDEKHIYFGNRHADGGFLDVVLNLLNLLTKVQKFRC